MIVSRLSSSFYRSSVSKKFRHCCIYKNKFSTLALSEIQPYNAVRIVVDEKEIENVVEFYNTLKCMEYYIIICTFLLIKLMCMYYVSPLGVELVHIYI